VATSILCAKGRLNNVLAEACASVVQSIEVSNNQQFSFEEQLFNAVVTDMGKGQSKFLDIPEGEDFLGEDDDDEFLKFEHYLKGVEGQDVSHLETELESEIESPLDNIDVTEYFHQTIQLFNTY